MKDQGKYYSSLKKSTSSTEMFANNNYLDEPQNSK